MNRKGGDFLATRDLCWSLYVSREVDVFDGKPPTATMFKCQFHTKTNRFSPKHYISTKFSQTNPKSYETDQKKQSNLVVRFLEPHAQQAWGWVA